MPIKEEAEENLRVIRSLMERATIYRAVSAEAALVGGLLAIAGSVFLGFNLDLEEPHRQFDSPFTIIWGVVLILAALCNLSFLKRAAAHRREALFSSGMKLALLAMAPSLLCGVFFTVLAVCNQAVVLLPPIWMLCYAVSLLATSHFAPRSLIRLGWCFLISGFVSIMAFRVMQLSADALAVVLMGATFGGFHLIYAVCAWPRRNPAETGDAP